MRYFVSTFLCVLLFTGPVLADAPSEVRVLLQGKVDAVMVLLQDQEIDKDLRNEQILDTLNPLFAYQTMARLSLGKKYWGTLSQEQQTTFSNLFIERLQNSYLDKLDIYTDEEIIYDEPLVKGKKIHQSTTLISKDRRIDLLYKFYRAATGWKIYDVEIGGVSVIQTYRSQFSDILTEGTIDDLLEKLGTDGNFIIPVPDEEGTRSGSE